MRGPPAFNRDRAKQKSGRGHKGHPPSRCARHDEVAQALGSRYTPPVSALGPEGLSQIKIEVRRHGAGTRIAATIPVSQRSSKPVLSRIRVPGLRAALRRVDRRKARSVAFALAIAVLPGSGVLLVLWLVWRRPRRGTRLRRT